MSITTPSDGDSLSSVEIIYAGNEFPTGDLRKLFRDLHTASKCRSHSSLAQFILDATFLVKQEIRQLPAGQQRLFGPFDTLLTWAEFDELRDGSLNGTFEGVLLTFSQIAAYIRYIEAGHGSLGSSESAIHVGLGVGLLTACAISCATTLTDLVVTGAEAVRIAFRMGVSVQATSNALEQFAEARPLDTWAYVVHNVDPTQVQKHLDLEHAKHATPGTAVIFISAKNRSSVTISGPPARLKALFRKSEFFRVSKYFALPVHGGLCHAPHIYSIDDARIIVQGHSLQGVASKAWQMETILSTSTGLPIKAENAASLFEQVVLELLTQVICWDEVVSHLCNRYNATETLQTTLYTFGNSVPLNELKAALEKTTLPSPVYVKSILVQDSSSAISDSQPRYKHQSKLAIVGMACRLPGGSTSTDKFWDILEQGIDTSQRIPSDRFDVETHFDSTGKQLNKTMTQYGCFIDEPGLFDAPFFNISPKEAQTLDPQMRLALVTAYEALERAGYVGNRTASTNLERIGTFYGQAADDYREVNQGQEVSTYYIPGGCRAFGPGRINYFFKFAGPSYSIDTACSSGLAAIELACQSLWAGEVDMAVAGGVNILTNPDGFTGLCKGHFLTTGHNACKTWDASADGYCRADGIGTVIIKRLEDAEADNDNILGVILGAGTNHSANAVSITHPHAKHQADLSRKIVRQAGVDPLDVSYVELHGTGTQAGDYEEMQGVLDVYAPLSPRRNKDQPLFIGSSKANVGHGESAAGSTALLKVLLMLQKGAIPPHIGIKTSMNPRFGQDFDQRNLRIPFALTPWPSQQTTGKKRVAVVNNFGAAGGNTTMVLEEAPIRDESLSDARHDHVISISAKTKAALKRNIQSMVAHINAHPDIDLADLGYTTTARRYHHRFRVALATSSIAQLKTQLQTAAANVDSVTSVRTDDTPAIAFTFTGQGASHKSMDSNLYRDVPAYREQIERFDGIARIQGFPSFVTALDGTYDKAHEHSPVVTQLALVCTEMALAHYWSSLGIEPDIVIGHSLGEYAAMYVAGVVTAADAIYMVGKRAQLLQERCHVGSHTMVAVRASVERISAIANNKPYTIACINGPSDTVLSGTEKQVADVVASLQANDIRCIKLDVAFAFHSDQTDVILEDFESLVESSVVFQEPRIPFISPLLGRVVFDGKTLNATYVRRATRETVNFVAALQDARKTSAIGDETMWIEVGPHAVCTNFIRSIIPSTKLAFPSNRRDESDWKPLTLGLAALHSAGVEIDWNEYHRPFERQRRLLDLPTYSFDDKNHWLQYNGDWCLTKGNDFYDAETNDSKVNSGTARSGLHTSSVHRIVTEEYDMSAGSCRVASQSDLTEPDLWNAAYGHRMNDCGVVTSSIHGDIAYTLGGYVWRKFFPTDHEVHIDIMDLVVTKGLVARKDQTKRQRISVTAETHDIHGGLDLTWANVNDDGKLAEPFATARLHFETQPKWLESWKPLQHLIQGRVEALDNLAAKGDANRLSHNMAYTLFSNNLVTYADKYRGMQTVIMHGLEAYADIQLTTEASGSWGVPPYFIDSVAHLAGFIMNCSDSINTKENFCITPGWRSMRFAKSLTPGARYRSYVKMISSAEDPAAFFGDVYIMQDGEIIGMIGGIEFHRYPRILLGRFFAPPGSDVAHRDASRISRSSTSHGPSSPAAAENSTTKKSTPPQQKRGHASKVAQESPRPPANLSEVADEVNQGAQGLSQAPSSHVATGALQLIADEAGLQISDLKDDTGFGDVGIDSLMSLVISEKLRAKYNIRVSGSLFLDYPTIGELRQWLEQYHDGA